MDPRKRHIHDAADHTELRKLELEARSGLGAREVVVKKTDELRSTTTTTVVEDVAPSRLTAEEERVLRMRSGASLPMDTRLENKLDAVAPDHRAEVTARLLLMERELLNRQRGTDHDQRRSKLVEALKGNRSSEGN